MKEIYTYLSPFIAAFVASYITYLFGIRAKKHEVLMAQRIPAFKAIQKQLVAFRRYYVASLSEMSGSEFAPKLEDLPEEERKSPLEQRQSLDAVLADNLIFLSKESRKCLDALDGSLELLCSEELLRASEPENQTWRDEVKGFYERILSQVDACTEEIYKELKLPA